MTTKQLVEKNNESIMRRILNRTRIVEEYHYEKRVLEIIHSKVFNKPIK